MKIKVLVVDDSAVIRSILTEIISAAPDLDLVGVVADATQASQAIKALSPDVLTLDIEMPGMGGLEFLEQVMSTHPMPVVMISNLTEQGSDAALRSLELGAVDFVAKPKRRPVGGMRAYADELCDKIRAAFAAHAGKMESKVGSREHNAKQGKIPAYAMLDPRILQDKLILIGASTGGTEAIREALAPLPEHVPAILIVQHMPEMFTGPFARRLDSLCNIRVKEAEHGERVKPGTAYLAPGHSHLSVKRVMGAYICALSKDDPVNRHRPAVDVLFNSAAQHVGANAVGVILTGMGKDGAVGMLAMRKSGGYNIAQDEQSSVVWGMPREATLIGAAHEVAPLHEITGRVLYRLRTCQTRGIDKESDISLRH